MWTRDPAVGGILEACEGGHPGTGLRASERRTSMGKTSPPTRQTLFVIDLTMEKNKKDASFLFLKLAFFFCLSAPLDPTLPFRT